MNLPDDMHLEIFLRLNKLVIALRYFRICKRTYNLKEWLLLQYNQNYFKHYIPPSKNPYPYLLMCYFDYKLSMKGRQGYKHYIMTFLASKNRDTTILYYKDYYHLSLITDFCTFHGLKMEKQYNNSLIIKK